MAQRITAANGCRIEGIRERRQIPARLRRPSAGHRQRNSFVLSSANEFAHARIETIN
ncbi:hypothetical protein [Desulfovibrio sp. ZJ369]|uniref:hypothetical protein n=1 Tax=Desulfovibrio sp. ZJ369 TaxID=2709793 RepID=UPI0013EAA0E4|nr:hypothetical protein [Desulfovibrio sp. ZJ369]